MIRRELAGVGFGALVTVAGLIAVVAPELFAGISVSYTVVILVGVIAALLGVSAATDRFTPGKEADLPEVEERTTMPAPGDAFDARVAGLPRRRTRGSKPDRARLRQRLEAAAIAAQTRAGLPRELAERRLIRGTWTNDPTATAFFRGGDPSGVARARLLARRESAFAERARAAAREVARVVETGDVPPITEEERAELDQARERDETGVTTA